MNPSEPLAAQEQSASDLMSSIVVVEPGQLPEFQKRLNKLNAKAAKFGLEPITVLSSAQVIYERKMEYIGRDMDKMLNTLVRLPAGIVPEHPVMLHRLEIKYPEVRLGKWQVVGRLETLGDSNLLFTVTDRPEDQDAARQASLHPINCEHCNAKRKRKESFVLRDLESGAYKQVGSTCMEDFTGIDPGAALFLAKMYEVVRLSEGELEEFAGSGRANAVSTRYFLADVSFLSTQFGFISAQRAREEGLSATFSEAIDLAMLPVTSKSQQEKLLKSRDHDLAVADAVRGWYASKPADSDFDRNVQLLLGQDVLALDRRHLALAAASVAMYSRQLVKDAESKKPSAYVGEVGKKLQTLLTVDRVLEIPNYFSRVPNYLVLMKDQDGNRFKWKTGAAPQELVDGAGRTLEATCKVKTHDEYKGVQQTSITHVKVLRWMDAANELVSQSLMAIDAEPTSFATPGSVRAAIAELVRVGPEDLVEGVGHIVVTTSGQLPASALAPEQTDAFQAWFDKSKVVDAEGKPLVVYHGTKSEFNAFAPNERGIFFTQDRDHAESYSFGFRSGPLNRIVDAYLSINNPWTYIRYGDDVPYSQQADQTPPALRALGYDGIKMPGGVWIAFEPGQIKSAAANAGTYDRNNPEFLHSATAGARVQAWHDGGTNTTVFLADRIPAGREASVFLHETVHRHGRQALPQGHWGALVGQVKAWADWGAGTAERDIHDAAQIRVATARVVDAAADEELFAYAVEEAVAMGIEPVAAAIEGSAEVWLQAVVDSIQRVGERLIGNDLQQLGGQDLVDLAYALAQLDSPVYGFEIRRALAVSRFPSELTTGTAIARYMQQHASDDIDFGLAEDYFQGAKAVKALVPLSSVVEGSQENNLRSAAKAAEYALLPPETVPPILIEDGVVMDGGHRLRRALSHGDTHIWAYVVQDEDRLPELCADGATLEFER